MRVLVTGQVWKVLALATALACVVIAAAHADPPRDSSDPRLREAVIQPAVDGIFAAFATHPLVGLADKHGLAQSMEFYESLIRDPRFARDVRNLVVEFGGAARQDVIDRYTNGDLVPYTELRQVWTDTVGWSPTVQHLGYAHFFAQVRETNRGLPPEKRIRVWLGDPPIVWKTIETYEEFFQILATRDSHAASIIIENILKRNQKALVIYGGQHFHPVSEEEMALRKKWAEADPENASLFSPTLQGLVESKYPDAFFIVQVYDGFDDESFTARFEQRLKDWPRPALAAPIRGTRLEHDMREGPSRSHVNLHFPATMPQALQDIIRAQFDEVLFLGDAILFHGPAADLTRSPMFPDLYLDEEYREEISRQRKIRTGKPLPPGWGRDIPVTPRPFR